jgi:hypothetical protein
MGLLDVGIDAQLQEVGRALLGTEETHVAPAMAMVEQPVHV